MPLSAVSQQQEPYCCHKSQNQFPAVNAGKLSAMNAIGAFYHLCSRRPMDMSKRHILADADEIVFFSISRAIPL
jgi:hypothetical protein